MVWRIAAGASLVLLVTGGQASAQGLLDFLLGAAAPTVPQAPADAGVITVHRPHAAPRPHKLHAEASAGKPANVAIDPVKVADWYLKDRTLRRGDIVVLKSGVLVFLGKGGEVKASDFVGLREAHGIKAGTRAFVMRATAANAYTAEALAPPKPKPHGFHATCTGVTNSLAARRACVTLPPSNQREDDACHCKTT